MPTTTLQLVFRNQEGRTVTISLNEPLEELEAQDIETVMDLIIEKNVFESAGGELIDKVAARIVAREVTTII